MLFSFRQSRTSAGRNLVERLASCSSVSQGRAPTRRHYQDLGTVCLHLWATIIATC